MALKALIWFEGITVLALVFGLVAVNLWRPGETEHETTYASANVGMRSAWLDPRRDRAELGRLLAGADVLFHNRRLPFLDEIGLTPGRAGLPQPRDVR